MKKIIISMLVIVFAISVTNLAFARDSLKSEYGYWRFDGIAEVVGSKIQATVWNQSTDDSYGSIECRSGMASVVMDVELWHPDAGRLSRNRISFNDVCNGGAMRKVAISNIPSKYSRLEVRFNVTTPNGGHSFHKGSTNWRR